MNQLFLFRKEMTPIRKLLLMKMFAGGIPISEYTATGNPLSFNTNLAKPLRSLLIPWTPVQSGSGDPYPPGGGKNLYDEATYPLVQGKRISGVDGTFASNSGCAATELFVPCEAIAGETVTLNKRPGGNTVGFGFYSSASEADFISGETNNNGYGGNPWTLTIPATAKYMRFTVQADKTQIQIEKGSLATAFAPYSNIRPISGVSALNVWHTGKNLAQFAPVVMAQDREKNGIKFHAVNKSLVHISGEASANTYLTEGQIETDLFLKAGKYTLSTNLPNDSTSRVYLDSKDATISYHAAYNEHPATITLANDTPNVNVQIMVNSGAEIDTDVWVMLVPGETASSYEPYTGQTYPVTFPALGKNLLNPATIEQGGIAENGTETVNSARVRTGYMPVEYGKTYKISATGFTCFTHYYDANKVSIEQNKGAITTPPTGAAYARCFFRKSDNPDIVPSDITDGMFAIDGTSYEPYTNTVYGGSLNLTTGELTVEYVVRDLGSFSWVNEDNYNSGQFRATGGNFDVIGKPKYEGNIFCDVFLCQKKASYQTLENGKISTTNGQTTPIIRVRNANYSGYTGEQFESEMNGYKMAYELYEPIVYQLTPQQITALLGDNVIWTDTNGSNTAVYLKKG